MAASILWASAAHAQTAPKRVLLLYSYEREFLHFTFARIFRPELARTAPVPIEFIEISLQTVRQDRADAAVIDDLRSTLGTRPLDLVVTLGGLSANFAQQHKNEIFPQTPVLMAAVDTRFLGGRALPPGSTALTVKNDPQLVLETMLRLMPDLKTVVVVIGASQLERFWLQEAQKLFRPFENRVRFIWTNELSTAELLARVHELPPGSAILFGIWSLDAKGVPQIEEPTLDALHEAANAPLFGLYTYQLGHGILGGPLLSMDDIGRDSAAVARRLLQGDAPDRIPPRTISAGTPTFDWRELRRWNIPEDRLEAGSIVLFREATLWQRYRALIIVATSVATAQLLLGIVLAITLARRRRAGLDDVAGLKAAEAALSRLSHRLMQASEHERASIAKTITDDVAQQLAALTLRLHALGVETEGRAGQLRLRIEELCGQFWALEREILALSDPVYHKLTILGLRDSAQALCERRCAEAGVTLEFHAGKVPQALPDAIALAVFRVLEEAVGNAIRHGHTSRLTVSLESSVRELTLDVVDEGVGFDADETLRQGALGLLGMRERMRLVGGTCAIESRAGAGARIHAVVPLSPS